MNGLIRQNERIGRGHFELTCLFFKKFVQKERHVISFIFANTEKARKSETRFLVAENRRTDDREMNWNYDREFYQKSIPNCNACAATVVTEQFLRIRRDIGKSAMNSLFLHVTILNCAVWPIAFDSNDFVDPMLMVHTLNWLW